jgi:hypothetical protein
MCTINIFYIFEYTFSIFHMLKSIWTLFKFNNLLSLLFSFILDFIELYKTCLNNKEILYNKSIVFYLNLVTNNVSYIILNSDSTH